MRSRPRLLIVFAVLALVAAACQDTTEDATTTTVASATAAAGDTTTTARANVPGFTYKTGIIQDITTDNGMAVIENADFYTGLVLGSQSAQLFTQQPPTWTLVPVLARDPEPPVGMADGDNWVIEVPLRQGLTWSDGEAVTADDYLFTFETVRDLDLGGNYLWAYPQASADDPATDDANEYNLGLVSVEAPDEYTLVLTWNDQPGLAVWHFAAALAGIFPEHFWGPIVDASTDAEALYAASGAGAPSFGPTVYSEREPGAFVRNVANENYSFKGATYKFYANGAIEFSSPTLGDEVWGGEPDGAVLTEYTAGPYLDDQLFKVYGSQDAAALALINGDIDYWLNPLPLSRGLQQQFLDADDLEVVANAGTGLFYLAFNTRRFPGNDLAFRQAVDCVIDKEFVAENILAGAVIPIESTVASGNTFWANPEVKSTCAGLDAEQRLNTATQILEDGGWTWESKPVYEGGRGDITSGVGLTGPDGQSVPEMTLLAPGPGFDPLRATYSLWAQNFMNDLGIPVTAEPTGFTVLAGKVFGPTDWDMYILGWLVGIFPAHVGEFFSSSQDSAAGGYNTPGYSNAEFDAVEAEFQKATDLETARELSFRQQEIIARDVPYVVLFTGVEYDVFRTNLHFPFTEFLQGIIGAWGLPELVQSL